MPRLMLTSGVVGDHDGAYDWVPEAHKDHPDYALGWHLSSWPGETYVVIEVPELPPYPKSE